MLNKIFLSVILAAVVSPAHAGIVGWITAKERSWSYVQQTGGIRVGQPTLWDGKTVLPVDYDATGITGITVRPTIMDSNQAVRRIDVDRAGNSQLVLTVVTQVVEENSNTARSHFADISEISAGTYDVFYGRAGEDSKFLGKITIP